MPHGVILYWPRSFKLDLRVCVCVCVVVSDDKDSSNATAAHRDSSGGGGGGAGSADEHDDDDDDAMHYYDRSKSFFDNISCESSERAKGLVAWLAVRSFSSSL